MKKLLLSFVLALLLSACVNPNSGEVVGSNGLIYVTSNDILANNSLNHIIPVIDSKIKLPGGSNLFLLDSKDPKFLRFEQRFGDTPVYGSLITVALEDGNAISISAFYTPEVLSSSPYLRLSCDQALLIASEFAKKNYQATPSSKSKPRVFYVHSSLFSFGPNEGWETCWITNSSFESETDVPTFECLILDSNAQVVQVMPISVKNK